MSLVDSFNLYRHDDVIIEVAETDSKEEKKEKNQEPKHPSSKLVFADKGQMKKILSNPKFVPIYVEPVKEGSYSDPRFNDLPPQMLKPPFMLLVVGQVRAGKSVLLMNFIYNPNFGYRDKFDEIIFISPSVSADGSLSELNNDIKVRKISSKNDLRNLDKIIGEIYDQKLKDAEEDKEKGKKIRRNTLLILDDVIGILDKSPNFVALSTKYRQPLISIIITTQMFRKIPSTTRENVSGVVIFPSYDLKEIKKFEEEYSAKYKDFKTKFYQATKEKYSFLFANLREEKLYRKFEEDITSKKNDDRIQLH